MRHSQVVSHIQISNFNELNNLIPYLKQKKKISNNLDDDKSLMIANLYECLSNTSHSLNKNQFSIFNVEEDLGIKMLQIGSKGGGYYGSYRCFKLICDDGNIIAGLGIHRSINKSRSLICVALQKDINIKPHHSLQLAVDNYLKVEDKFCILTHKGTIGLGSLGTGKNSILMNDYVKPIYPKIINGNEYLLGKLPSDKLWILNDDCIEDLIENLISYSILRDRYREDAKKAADIK